MLEFVKRSLKHRLATNAKRLVSDAAMQRLKLLVAQSEQHHSGEIRICIEARLPHSYLIRNAPMAVVVRERAIAQFGKLHVWDTQHNNGVLIYLLLCERSIELVADRGLANHVTPQVWQGMVQRLSLALKQGQFEMGLEQAITDVSGQLKTHFSVTTKGGNPNELPDLPARR